MAPAARNRSDERENLLRGWLADLAGVVACKYGLDSDQYAAITQLQANIDDAVLARLHLSDIPQFLPEMARHTCAAS